jgi:hypothetical protein
MVYRFTYLENIKEIDNINSKIKEIENNAKINIKTNGTEKTKKNKSILFQK